MNYDFTGPRCWRSALARDIPTSDKKIKEGPTPFLPKMPNLEVSLKLGPAKANSNACFANHFPTQSCSERKQSHSHYRESRRFRDELKGRSRGKNRPVARTAHLAHVVQRDGYVVVAAASELDPAESIQDRRVQ